MGRKYIIMTVDSLKPCLQRLVTQKQNRGFDIVWIDVPSTSANTDTLRQQVISHTDSNRGCLLIVGDYDLVPGYSLTWRNRSILSDTFYSMLDGDVTPRLMTGRLSTNDPNELSDICDRLVGYNLLGGDRGWLRRVILTGWVPRGRDYSDPRQDLDAGWSCRHEIGEYFDVEYRFQNDISCTVERREVWEIQPGDRKQNLVDAIEEGALIVRYLGHGLTDRWANIGANEYFNVFDVRALNVSHRLPLVISASCLTGDIENQQSFAETWLSHGKAIGVFASDEVSATYWNDRITQRIFNQIITNGQRYVGDILIAAMWQLYNDFHDLAPHGYERESLEWMPRMYRYLGDPDTLLPFDAIHHPGAVVSWQPYRLDLFNSNTSGHIQHQWHHGGWGLWENLGGDATSFNWCYPAAVSWGPGRLDVFVRGCNEHLYHNWYEGGWGHWEDLGGQITTMPTVVSWGTGRLDIFARGIGNDLQHLWFEGQWDHWESLGGDLSSPDLTLQIAVTSWAEQRLDIFYRNRSNHLQHLWFHRQWGQWEDLGGSLKSDPTVVSWGPNRLDIFARNDDNQLAHLWFHHGWGQWERKGGQLAGKPVAVSWGPGRLDIFARGQDDCLLHNWFHENYGGWGNFENKGGRLSSDPIAVCWGQGRLDVFARGFMNHLMHLWYEDNWGWGNWEDKTTNR